MDDLKEIFAANLSRLRNNSGMTQACLAQVLNYSDKSVSKWERGEAVPDAAVLKQLSDVFGVTVDELLSEESAPPRGRAGLSAAKHGEYSRVFIILCVIVGIWTLSIFEFVVLWIVGSFQWLLLVLAVPLSLIALLVFNSVWYKGRYNMYIVGALVLSIIGFIYLALLKHNCWQLLLILIPAEALVYLGFHIKKKKRIR